MAINLFPPSRSSDNLTYLILPLAFGILGVSLFSTYLNLIEWIQILSILVSLGALFLYLLEPVSNGLNWYYRRKLDKNENPIFLEMYVLFRCWRHIAVKHRIDDDDIHIHVYYMIQSALSSSIMKRRLAKLRSAIYFVIAFPIYFCSGLVVFLFVRNYLQVSLRFDSVPILDIIIIVGYLIISVCFVILIFQLKRGESYVKNIERDISYFAEYLYMRELLEADLLKDSENKDSIRDRLYETIKFYDRLILSEDLGLFVMYWKEQRGRLKWIKTRTIEEDDCRSIEFQVRKLKAQLEKNKGKHP